jgi:replicative DNA helicase
LKKANKPGLVLDRVLPNSLDAEMAVLGAMLLSPQEAGAEVIDQLKENFFYYAAHQVIFREVSIMLNAMNALDLITLTQRLQDKNQLEAIGGPVYLSDLVSHVPTTANVEHYINIVREKHLLRQLIGAAHDVISRSFEQQDDVDEWILEVQKVIGDLATGKVNVTSMKDAVAAAMGEIETVLQSERHITGFTTGFKRLDEETLGLNPPDVWIIAGRPSDGKSALAGSIAASIAEQGTPVGFITLEQSSTALAKRTLASWSKVNMRHLREMSEDDKVRLTGAAIKIGKLPIYFDDRPALNGNQIRSTARTMNRKFGCKVFILDYLQLADGDSNRYNRNNDIASVTAVIKSTAKELGAAFIVLSQLNREAGKHNVRPSLINLRDSGAIEQDADIVGIINRDLTEEELPTGMKGKFSNAQRERIAQLHIAKQREGERDVKVYLQFLQEFTRFENLEIPHVEAELPYRDEL